MKNSYYTIFLAGAVSLVALFLLIARVNALFSAEVEIKNNVIKTGSVAIAVTPNEQLLTSDALLPGQSVHNTLEVRNTGRSPVHLQLSSKKSAGYTSLYDQLRFTISSAGNVIFEGSLKDAISLPLTVIPLLPTETALYDVALLLPEDAGDTIDNLSTTINFTVAALQAG